jgi:phage terminase small subunit
MEGINPLHKEFAKEYLETGNGTQSILNVDPVITSPESAAVKASRLLRNDKVKAYLENLAEKAATRIEQLMEQSENLPVALSASKDIMDRAGFKPVEKQELSNPDGNLKTIIINKHASDNQSTT